MAEHVTQSQVDAQWRFFYRIGGYTAIIQTLCMVTAVVVGIGIGSEPETAEEYFQWYEEDKLSAILRLDFATYLMVLLFSVIGLAIFGVIRQSNQPYALLGLIFVQIGVAMAMTGYSDFSVWFLAEEYVNASSEAERDAILVAGQAVFARNWWNSGPTGGIFLQGGIVISSIVMLKHGKFSKITAYTGLIANGTDLFQELLSIFVVHLDELILMAIAGPAYVLWFPFLARDLFRYGKEQNLTSTSQENESQ